MIKIFLLLFSITIFAKEGVITVLEAPIFSSPSMKSKVIQYKRKGDKLYIHSESFRKDHFSEFFDTNKDQLLKTHKEYQENFKDPLFDKKYKRAFRNFYRTLTRSGRVGYIAKDHVFLLYEDKRELDQYVIEKDPTDYRIAEPLPKGYPLKQVTGYKGQVNFSLGTPTDQPYPYSEKIKDTGFDFNKEFTVVWAKQVSYDHTKRFFFGGEFNFMSGKSKYITANIDAYEEQIRLGIGPYLAYDVWRQEKNLINIHTSLILNFYDSKEIDQSFKSKDGDRVLYNSLYFSPKLGADYQRKNLLGPLDFIIGVKLLMHSPHTYKASKTPSSSDEWVSSYKVGFSVEQAYYIGIQTAY